MKEKFSKWNASDYLETDQDIIMYFDACLDEDPGDGSVIRVALGDISRARGMSQLAKETGISREGLYKALSANGNPEFSTIMKVIKALGLNLHTKGISCEKRHAACSSG